MTDENYNRYIQLINRRYKYDFHNQRRYDLVMKLMSWQYHQARYERDVEEVV